MLRLFLFFFFNDTATTEIYTLSLHDALPIYQVAVNGPDGKSYKKRAKITTRPEAEWIAVPVSDSGVPREWVDLARERSEEHTSELQSRQYLVCRLLLEKKNTYYQLLSCSTDT